MKKKYKTLNVKDLSFDIKVGDVLNYILTLDPGIYSMISSKITSIHKNGIIRVKCNNKQCKKRLCTYLHMYSEEIKTVKIK